jgi:hypothetical protein
MWDKQQKENQGITYSADTTDFNLSNSDVRSLMQTLKLHEDDLKDAFPDIVALLGRALPDSSKLYRAQILPADSMLSPFLQQRRLGPARSQTELQSMTDSASSLLAPGEREEDNPDNEFFM